MASKGLSEKRRAGVVAAIGSLVLFSPPAAVCATVGWAAHEAHAWWTSEDEPKDKRRD